MLTVLTDADVLRRLDAAGAVEAMRQAVLAAHRGDLVAPPRVRAGVLTFTAGRLAGRWYGYRSYDTHLGGQQVVALHAEPTGELVGVAVGTAIGAYRTGALGGAAVDVLARPRARTLGVVGTGRQAWTQVWAITAVRALSHVAVYSRTPGHSAAFADRVSSELRVAAGPVSTAERAVTGRDIVVLATSSATPVLDTRWLSPGTAITTVGPKQVGRAEFPPDLATAAGVVVTDSPAQLAAFDPPALLADGRAVGLGGVIAGEHPGRTGDDEITVYASVGLAGTEPYLLAHLLDR